MKGVSFRIEAKSTGNVNMEVSNGQEKKRLYSVKDRQRRKWGDE